MSRAGRTTEVAPSHGGLSTVADWDRSRIPQRSERWVAAAFVVAGSVIGLLRTPPATWGTFYAEDGRTFIGQWINGGGPGTFVREYAGYQHFLPRVVSFFVQLLPIGLWAYATTAVACLVVALCGAISFLATRDTGLHRSGRVAVGLVPILSPLAGFEALGSIANLHWYVTYVLLWVLMASPTSRAGWMGFGLVAASAALTEPQTAILLPICLIQLYRTRGRSWPTALGWALGMLGQFITWITHPLVRTTDLHDLTSAALGFAVNAAGGTVFDTGEEIGFVIVRGSTLILFTWTVLLLAAGITGAILATGVLRVVAAAAMVVAVLSWSLSWFLNDHSRFEYAHMTDTQFGSVPLIRWGTTAAILLPLGVIVLLQTVGERWPRVAWLPAAGGIAMVVVMLIGGFRSDDNRRGGTAWKVALVPARAACADPDLARIRIETYPAGWPVTVPCSLLRE